MIQMLGALTITVATIHNTHYRFMYRQHHYSHPRPAMWHMIDTFDLVGSHKMSIY